MIVPGKILLAVLAGLAPLVFASLLTGQRGGAAARAESPLEAVPDADAWRTLLTNDKRIAFTERTAGDARALLSTPDLSTERRAIALMAIGAGGAIPERGELERIAKTGTGLERKAAILALGEMGMTQAGLFDECIAKAPKPVGECALLALLRGDRGAGRRRVEEIAGEADHPLAAAAKDALVFIADPFSSRPTSAGALLLRLRWQAARQLGLVDGRGWSMLVIAQLARDPQFVHEVVLGAAARIRSAGVKDHVLPELLAGHGPARLRAAVAVMPRELSDLVENELWMPADAGEWSILLDAIAEGHLERLAIRILRAASAVAEVRYRAVALLSLAGDEELKPLIGLDASLLSVEERIQVCAAIGARDDTAWLPRFAGMRTDKDVRVRLAFEVAAMRLGDKKSAALVDDILSDSDREEHAALVGILCGVVRDPGVGARLEDRLSQAEGEERVRIATSLCLDGRLLGRTQVRAALAAEPPPRGAQAVRLVRALRKNGTIEDLEILRALFPTEDDPALDLALATALADLGDASVLPLLRAAMWSKEWDQSLLAAGLLVDAQGVHMLRGELRLPPTTASSHDLRRLGFALGEWGGIAALQDLARELRYASGDPALQGAYLGVLSTRTQ